MVYDDTATGQEVILDVRDRADNAQTAADSAQASANAAQGDIDEHTDQLGALSVGDLVRVQSVAPLALEGVPSDTFRLRGAYDLIADEEGIHPDSGDVGNAIQTLINNAPDGARILFREPGAYITSRWIGTNGKPLEIYFGAALRVSGGTASLIGPHLRQADGAELDTIFIVDREVTGRLAVDGNKANNAADVIGVRVDNSTQGHQYYAQTINCDIGTQIFDASEASRYHCVVSACGIGVQEKENTGGTGDSTPDTNHIYIEGRDNDGPWYDKDASAAISSYVTVFAEQTTGPHISLAGGSEAWTMLDGVMRGSDNDGLVAASPFVSHGLRMSVSAGDFARLTHPNAGGSTLDAPILTGVGGTAANGVVVGVNDGDTPIDNVAITRPYIVGVDQYSIDWRAATGGVLLHPVKLEDGASTGEDVRVSDNSWLRVNRYYGSVSLPYRTAQGLAPNAPGGYTTTTLANESMYLVPVWVEDRHTLSRIGVQVTTAGPTDSVIRLGVYEASGKNLPEVLAAESATVAADSTGVKQPSISPTVNQGWHWLAVVAQNSDGTVEVNAMDGRPLGMQASSFGRAVQGNDRAYERTGVTDALPTPLDPANLVSQSKAPLIAVGG